MGTVTLLLGLLSAGLCAPVEQKRETRDLSAEDLLPFGPVMTPQDLIYPALCLDYPYCSYPSYPNNLYYPVHFFNPYVLPYNLFTLQLPNAPDLQPQVPAQPPVIILDQDTNTTQPV